MQKKSWGAEYSLQKKIEEYSPMVYRLAYSLVKCKEDADDIHQEVFIKYIKKQPNFENTEHEKAWFIRVTINQCKNWWKKAWKNKMVSFYELEEKGREAVTSQDMLCNEDKELMEKVKMLGTKYRVVIHLFYYEELTVDEIATVLDKKASTVRTHLTRARRKLRDLLKEDL